MKTRKWFELLTVAGVMFMSGSSQLAYGQAEKIGNGGSGYEAEFSGYQSEIMAWVNKTGLENIALGSIDREELVTKLTAQSVRVSFVDQELYVNSKERSLLKEALKKIESEVVEIPCIIGGQESDGDLS